MGKIIEIKISELKDKFDIRNIINDDHVQLLWSLIEGGTPLPPIKITPDFIIIDGRHRVKAYEYAGREIIKAEILEKDGMICIVGEALKCNMGGSLPPTKADLRRVMTILINKNYSKKRIYEEFKDILPLSLIKTSYQYAILRINNKKTIEAIQLMNDSNFSKEKAALMMGISENWITKKLSTSIVNGEYVQATKAELSGLFAHFNKKAGKTFSTILQAYDDAVATKNDTQRIIKSLGILIANQNRMYGDWQKRWNYKK